MPSLPGDGSVQACPKCAALIDVSEQEPLAKIQCPACGASMRVSRQFNQFTIIEALGNGGMGEVYKALDRNLNRMVALKLLRPELSADEDYIIKLEDEARITASINHPYVVKVFSFDHDKGQYYIAMELVDKGSLDDLMQLQQRVAELQVLQVGLQVASGLQAAHERGLIHRDVKPGNILFADAQTAKITDFGLALLAEHEAEARGEIWGTPYYIAPEKLNHEKEDFRSDIYSLGGTLFHAAAGRPPFDAETASMVALKHLKSRAVSLQAFAPDISNETAYVINRMLNKDPADRYGSYDELIEHLQYAHDTLTTKIAQPRVAKERVVVEPESQRNVAGLLTLLLLALVLVGGVLTFALRDRLFGVRPSAGSSAAVTPAPGGVNKDAAEIAWLYAEARDQLAAGHYEAAKASFAALAARPNLPQPMPNWVRLHQGLLALLGHQLGEARGIFADLQKNGAFSDREADNKLVSFFTETGRYLADDKPIPVNITKVWNKNTFENLSILLFGLKDWELGNFDAADKLLQEYLAGNPGEGFQWISGYAPLARQRVQDYALYAPLRDQLKAPPTDPAARAALQAKFAQARGQLQTSGKLAEAFAAAEAELQKTPAPTAAAVAANTNVNANGSNAASSSSIPSPAGATSNPAASPAPTASAEETQRWRAALDSFQQMARLYRFEQAASVLQKAQLKDPELLRAQEQARKRAQRLIAFKRDMIVDLQARGGYPQPAVTRRSATYQRGIQSATEDALTCLTPYGTASVPWTDFAPKTLFTVANYLADKTPDPKLAAERRWAAATFALENGMVNEGRALAASVARDQPGYKDELPQLLAAAGGTTNPAASGH